jgi:hypothetical protein
MLSEFLSPVVQGSGWGSSNSPVTIFYCPVIGVQAAPTGKLDYAEDVKDRSKFPTRAGTGLGGVEDDIDIRADGD